MALIQCPECGKQISSSAPKCVHCGKELQSMVGRTKKCEECGKEIDENASLCPYCGKPFGTESPKELSTPSQFSRLKTKKWMGTIVALVVLFAMILFVCIISSKHLNKYEQLAYENAAQLKEMLSYPESLKISNIRVMERHTSNTDDTVEYIYTLVSFSAKNRFGTELPRLAIFKDDQFVMIYENGPDETASNYIDQLWTSVDMDSIKAGNDKFVKPLPINVDKIVRKMDLK